MGQEPDRESAFDAFYQSTRRTLLHQVFALTGDLPAASTAVRDAYVAAWHHWRKVSRLPDPSAWVRPWAWEHAQRRHTARIWHRTKGISEEHKRTLDALAKLSTPQRRVILLTDLAGIPLTEAARELSMTRLTAAEHLAAGRTRLGGHLGLEPSAVGDPVLALGDELGGTVLPRASSIRRAGQRRSRIRTVVGVTAAVAVVVGSGAFAYDKGEPVAAAQRPRLIRPTEGARVPVALETGAPTADQLLDTDQIRRLGMRQQWREDSTGDNTSGDGINAVCQPDRFADPDGLAALVRTFSTKKGPARSAVQMVEVSKSAKQARQTFRTTVQWYADCRVARLQVLNAYEVNRLGDEASVLMLRVWKRPVRTYSVAVARVGSITTSTIGTTVGAAPPPPGEIVQSLADSVAMLCPSTPSQVCATSPRRRPAPPPPSGEGRGMLAVPDLPPVGRILRPWVGTKPTRAPGNPSTTTCVQADFGATRSSRTRTFLIPQARLPARFGLSETYGVFRDDRAARAFLAQVRSRVSTCADRDLATKVSSPVRQGTEAGRRDLSSWMLTTEISAQESVRFRVGFVRVGNRVAQISFVPTPSDDISPRAFLALLNRAGDRLLEL